MHRFLVVIEKAGDNYSAYSPDLPGCVATGATREEAERNMCSSRCSYLTRLKLSLGVKIITSAIYRGSLLNWAGWGNSLHHGNTKYSLQSG